MECLYWDFNQYQSQTRFQVFIFREIVCKYYSRWLSATKKSISLSNSFKVFSKNKYYREVPFGYDSVKCVGHYTPDPTKHKTIGTGIVVPIGKTVVNDTIECTTDFDINQFIVFDKSQLIVRYLVQYYEQQK